MDRFRDIAQEAGRNRFEQDLEDKLAERINLSEQNTTFNVNNSAIPPDKGKRGSIYLEDGIRKVDYVLVFNPKTMSHNSKREVFEEELTNAGLVLEYVRSNAVNGGLEFVLIHAPWEVLSCFAEIMRLKMPVKKWLLRRHEIELMQEDKKLGEQVEIEENRHRGSRLHLEPPALKGKQFSIPFDQAKEYLFEIPERKEEFFNGAQRAQIVHFILQRKRFSRSEVDSYHRFDFGINRLLADGVYLGAFPLHEGSVDVADESPRYQLWKHWASLFAVFQAQPLDDIKRYFGVKVGLYFAWLGFYTYMLIPASVIGILCFAYGFLTVKNHDATVDICYRSSKHIVMCPTCDDGCEYWKLGDTCPHVRSSYFFDNAATVFFTVVMAIWAACFLEMWKRYSARITYQWDLSGFDAMEENSRPEYLARLARLKKEQDDNAGGLIIEHGKSFLETGDNSRKILEAADATRKKELPFWRRQLPIGILSFSIVILLVFLAIAAVIGVILYRMTVRAALALSTQNEATNQLVPLITSSTAAVLNLFCILVFNMLYGRLSVYLTDLEMPRTQTEYDNSLTVKLYLLQFVNCYSSIFYIALFKGKFVGRPGKYNYLFGHYLQEECGTGGCFLELSVQLAIIMIGKQAFSAFYEMLWPTLLRFLAKTRVKRNAKTEVYSNPDGGTVTIAEMVNEVDDPHLSKRPWERDYTLPDLGPVGLFYEYLEMILQYGFVTLFVAAFPLAPFFALVNNVLEIRLDARKLLGSYRRPVAQRVKDIGVWFRIMDSIGKFAVLSNAVIIAFTSEFIPRLYYKWKFNANSGDLVGFYNFTLSYFDTTMYDANVIHRDPRNLKEQFCRYTDYRTPPWDPKPYKRTVIFWELLVWKFAFVFLFQNLISMITTVIRWMIPDVPRSIREKIREDSRLTNEVIILQELRRRKDHIERSGSN